MTWRQGLRKHQVALSEMKRDSIFEGGDLEVMEIDGDVEFAQLIEESISEESMCEMSEVVVMFESGEKLFSVGGSNGR